MDENNMNNLNNGVDEEDEATTVLVAPGVAAAQPPKPEAKADPIYQLCSTCRAYTTLTVLLPTIILLLIRSLPITCLLVVTILLVIHILLILLFSHRLSS